MPGRQGQRPTFEISDEVVRLQTDEMRVKSFSATLAHQTLLGRWPLSSEETEARRARREAEEQAKREKHIRRLNDYGHKQREVFAYAHLYTSPIGDVDPFAFLEYLKTKGWVLVEASVLKEAQSYGGYESEHYGDADDLALVESLIEEVEARA